VTAGPGAGCVYSGAALSCDAGARALRVQAGLQASTGDGFTKECSRAPLVRAGLYGAATARRRKILDRWPATPWTALCQIPSA